MEYSTHQSRPLTESVQPSLRARLRSQLGLHIYRFARYPTNREVNPSLCNCYVSNVLSSATIESKKAVRVVDIRS
jgi:hypothetical protein